MTELLVGIAILGVLATLITTASMRAVRQADLSACQSNLRQVGVAINLYTVDHNGQLPGPAFLGQNVNYAVDGNGEVIEGGMIISYLTEYLNLPNPGPNRVMTAEIYLCPAWERIRRDEAGLTGRIVTGFPYQANTAYFGSTTSDRPPVRIGQVTDAASVPALVETDNEYPGAIGGGADSRLISRPAHDTVRNQLFLDGHVESVPVED